MTPRPDMMARAIRLAERGKYTVSPNPAVGAVVVKDGAILAEGWHRKAGGPHAEKIALDIAGGQAAGSDLYVTLEPCSHFGRTPPCVDAVINAGVKRVIYGMEDPNPQVAGQGLEKLRQAGIEVLGPLLENDARQLNRGFIKRHTTGLPRVTLKMAMSLDGRTAMASGESQWITGSEARRDVQRLRAASCAIVTGIETVLKDNPRLTVRPGDLDLEGEMRQPLRVVLDSRGRLPADAPLLQQGGPVLQVVSTHESRQPAIKAGLLEQIGLPGNSGIDLHALLKELAERHCNEVLVEAGPSLAGAFIQSGLVDEMVIYMAPTLMGSEARPLFMLPLDAMNQQKRLKLVDYRLVGDDLRLTFIPKS